MVLIAAEMLAQNPGLGKFVWDEFQNGSSNSLGRIMVAVLAIGLVGFMLDKLMLTLQKRVSWDKQAVCVERRSSVMSMTYPDITGVGIEFDRWQQVPRPAERQPEDEQGEFISLIGHSGCGKSTVLNIVAGLYRATEGGGGAGGNRGNRTGPDRAVVFQNHR